MTILLAEDETDTREMISEILTDEGYQVLAASNGQEALSLWHESPVDVLLLDIMMPYKSGYEVCREVRQSDPEVPVMFVSAKSEEIDVVVGLELGADDFLRKPFGKHELLARIRALLRRSAQKETSVHFDFGPWKVFSTELRATKEDEEIDLTPREVRLLQLFFKHSGKTLTRDEILNECWGMDYFPESRTLDQHISNLRKKVGTDLIETIRGIGYQFSL